MPAEIYFSKFVDCILAINLFWCFFFNNFFQSIFQNIFAQLLLIIYTSSTFFLFSLVKSSNRKSKRCKHFITLITIFTENFGEEISHIGECSEVFQGSVLCPVIYQDRRSAEVLLGSIIFIPQSCTKTNNFKICIQILEFESGCQDTTQIAMSNQEVATQISTRQTNK